MANNNVMYVPIRGPLRSWQNNALSAFFVFFLYFSFVGLLPFGPRLPFELADTGQGDTIQRALFMFTSGCVFLIALMVWDFRAIKMIGPSIFLALGWIVVSVLWSDVPDATLKRSIYVVIMITTIFTITALLGPDKVFKILFYTLLFMIVASLISGPIVPNAIHREGMRGAEDLIGRWRGVFIHKNTAGAASAFLFLLSIQQIVFGGVIKNKYHLLAGVLCSLFMLFLAYSKTSLGLIVPSLLVSGVFYYFIAGRDFLHRTLLFIGIISFLLLLVCLGAYFDVLSVINDPAAFTGRAEIWNVVFRMISDEPFFGRGYGAVFEVGERTPLLGYTSGWALLASHAHNGYLQVVVEQGFIGLFFSLMGFVIMPLWRTIYSPTIPKEYLAPAMAMMTFFVLNNMTETTLMLKMMCQWTVYVIILSIVYYYANINLFMRPVESEEWGEEKA